MYGGIFMNQLKELANELGLQFLREHAADKEALRRQLKSRGGDNLDSILNNWYKYCVDGKPSTKRYRVIKIKELNMNKETNTGAAKDNNTDGAEANQKSTEQPTQPNQSMFSNIIDGLVTKIKNNRGLLGMVAGVGLTYAGQAAYDRYQEKRYGISERQFVKDVVEANRPEAS